jgi:serine/threonine-protein kinase
MSAVSRHTSDLAAGVQVGDYIVDGKIGEGGTATVYLGIHPMIGKKAAIKVMAPELSADEAAVDRFMYEARSVNEIGHPNIVDIFAFGKLPDGRSYFVMEWLAGDTLAARQARGRLGDREATHIFLQICDALDAAHHVHIIHRDLKPENVFLVAVRGGRTLVKLLDFGLAKVAVEKDKNVRRTQAGVIMGTPAYLSPEQGRGQNITTKTDVYSLGVMMYEAFVGKLPYDSPEIMDLIHMHLFAAVPSPMDARPDMPPELGECIRRMMSKDATERPTLDEVRDVLGSLRDGGNSGEFALPRVSAQMPAVTPSGQQKMIDPHSATLSGQMATVPARVSGTIPPVPARTSGEQPAVPPVEAPGRRRRLVIAGAVTVPLLVVAMLVIWPRMQPKPQPVLTTTPAPVVIAPPPTPPPSAPEKPAPPQRATLRVHVDVASTIAVDGKIIVASASHATVPLEAGSHNLQVTAPRRQPYQETVILNAGQVLEVPLTMKSVSVKKPGARPTKPGGSGGEDAMVDPFGNK